MAILESGFTIKEKLSHVRGWTPTSTALSVLPGPEAAFFFSWFSICPGFFGGAPNQGFLVRFSILARRRRKFWAFYVYKMIFVLFLKHFETIFDQIWVRQQNFANTICPFFYFRKSICPFLHIYNMFKKKTLSWSILSVLADVYPEDIEWGGFWGNISPTVSDVTDFSILFLKSAFVVFGVSGRISTLYLSKRNRWLRTHIIERIAAQKHIEQVCFRPLLVLFYCSFVCGFVKRARDLVDEIHGLVLTSHWSWISLDYRWEVRTSSWTSQGGWIVVQTHFLSKKTAFVKPSVEFQ